MDQDEAFESILSWGEKYKDLLIEGQRIQGNTSIHLRLSIERFLKYGDDHHFKIPDREFLEAIIKENNELLNHYDKFSRTFSEFESKTVEIMTGLGNDNKSGGKNNSA